MCMSVAEGPRSRPSPKRLASFRICSSASRIFFSVTVEVLLAKRLYNDELRAHDESFWPLHA
ncbi:MAG: hypothetical protein JWN06_1062 [Propionibacteriaceae bacterium]|nr:hypothetical protein [Propionibacteriaceae bacterium]